MVVLNEVSRYHLVQDAINNATRAPAGSTELKAWCEAMLAKHRRYVVEHLEDMPEVRDWMLDRDDEGDGNEDRA
jgi:xylulose-5-phosphate/fructose-6-phosphate phosphoketolase